MRKKGPIRKVFNLLTGVVVGGAIGSILGLTLAPKKGSDARKYLKKRSQEFEGFMKDGKKKKHGPVKRFFIKILTPKNRK